MTALPTTLPTREKATAAAELEGLYERDEVEWCDEMAALIGRGRTGELDFANLKEVLEDMGKRDRREVKSRLRVLLMHWLKWEFQPEMRTGSWLATLQIQRGELAEAASDSRTLRNHLAQVLDEVYAKARRDAAAETGLPPEIFPEACPVTLDELLAE